MFKQKITVAVLLCAILPILFTQNISASGGLTVSQMKIVFEAGKDDGAVVPIKVTNTSNELMSVSVRKSDYIIAEDGAFQEKDPGSTANSADKLIKCDEIDEFLEPGTSKTYNVKFVSAGELFYPEYSSAVLIKYATKSTVESKANIITYIQNAVTVRVLSGSLLKKDIDTSVAPLKVVKLGGSRVMKYGGIKNIPLIFKNNGVLTVEPRVTLKVTSIFSGEVQELKPFNGFVTPGRERIYTIGVKSGSILDYYTLTTNYEYVYSGKNFKDSAKFSYLIVSYQLVIGVILVLAGIIFQIIMFRKKSKMIKMLMEQNKKEDITR